MIIVQTLVQEELSMELIRRWCSFRLAHPILSGLFYAFAWMLFGALILSILLWMTQMQEQDLSLYTYIVHAFAMLSGGFVAGKRSTNKGWYQGGITGILYGLIVLLVGFLALDAGMNGKDLMHLGIAFVIGAGGGMFGINFSK
jgi:putative membrane protein (TIGR04086 family)